MSDSRPRFVLEELVDQACQLREQHGVRALDILTLQLGLLGQLAGPAVTFEGRPDSIAWPFMLVSQTDHPPAWLEPVLEPLRAEQQQLGSEIDGILKKAYPAGTAELMKETAAHLRGFGRLFEQEALDCEEGARLAANPPASTFVHLVDGNGPLLPRKGPRQAGEGATVIVNGDKDTRSILKARESERAIARHLRHPDLHPRVLLAARWSEKAACRLVHGRHKLRIEPCQLLLPIVTGHPCEGDISSHLKGWQGLVRTLLSRRCAGVPWEFQPADRITARVTKAEVEIVRLVEPLGKEAKEWAAVLKGLPWKLTGLAHYLEHVHGDPGIRHGNPRLAAIAAHLAVMIAGSSIRWLGQVLPNPDLGLSEYDTLVCDYIRRHAPLTAAELSRRMPGLKAAERDRALECLMRAGHVELRTDGMIRCLVR